MTEYVRLCTVDGQGRPVNVGQWIPYGSNPHKYIKDRNKAQYLSTFIYNEEQHKKFQQVGSIAGMADVVTDKLYWDFDSKDLEKAKSDVEDMASRLISHGIAKESILICFSGKKGFSVEVKVDKRLKPEEVKHIAAKMAEGLETFDIKVYDSARILRIPNTRHQDSGLYKLPVHLDDLEAHSLDELKSVAAEAQPETYPLLDLPVVSLPQSILELKRTDTKDRVTTATIMDPVDLDFKHKPKGFSNCKFAILNGFFPDGSRNHSLIVLASTCRANGFPKEVAYNMAKAASRLQSQRYGQEPFSKEEIWGTVIKSVYGDRWNGGQYTCKSDHVLRGICESLGSNKCKHEDSVVIPSEDVFGLFKKYAMDFENNALTTGIEPLDQKVKFLVGTSAGILAPPGVGKSSFAFSMLNHNSNLGIPSIFFSYDMHHSILYLRLLQKHYGLEQEDIFNLVKDNSPKVEEMKEFIKEQYKNVLFCFRNGQTPDDVNRTIMEAEEKIGSKIKLGIVDYSELVVAETSDPTQASAQIAQKMRQIANERELALVSLYQPTKHNSNPAEEANSYQAAKGSGAIAQSVTLMLGLSRPGFHPRYPEQDRFFTVSALKNRMGPLFTLDLSWNGLRGAIGELDYGEMAELKAIRDKKELEKADDNGF